MPSVMYLTILFFFSTLASAETLVFYADNWAPYNYIEDDRVVGISTELLEEALQKTPFKYEIKMRPWKRAYLEVQETPFTALYTVNRSPQREKLFKWIGPLYPSDVYLFRLKSRGDIQINEFNDLKKYRIGALRAGSVHLFLQSKGIGEEQLELMTYTDQLLKMMLAGRLELVPGDEIAFAFQLKREGKRFSDFEKAYLLYKGSYCIGLNRDTPDYIAEILQKALAEVIAEGARERILNKHLE